MNQARLLAVRSLVSIRKSGRYANLELDAALKKAGLDARDGALFTALVYGVLERDITLDHFIDLFCNRRGRALPPFLRATLQCALYQLEYMPSIPQRAVLYESAEIAKLSEKQSGANLVSAVLHAFLRAKEANKDLFDCPDALTRRSVMHSIPKWMLSLWDKAYGQEKSEKIAASFATACDTTLHVNTLKTTRDDLLDLFAKNGVSAAAHDTEFNLITLAHGHGDVRSLCGYEDGLFFVQDYSSACTVGALDPRPGEEVADVCAAPGGKTFAIAIRMQNQGRIHSSDLHKNRTTLIARGAERLGITNVSICARDARQNPEELIGKMDRVLCDVPCSGLGVLRKKPDLRHKSEQEITALPSIQLEILKSASQLLKTGGRLVYSTCTLNPAENEEVIQEFISHFPDFKLIQRPTTLFPCDGNRDGFFYTALEKTH